MAKRIGMIYCERIQDASCVGCAKCYKSVNENTFAFEEQGEVRVVFCRNQKNRRIVLADQRRLIPLEGRVRVRG